MTILNAWVREDILTGMSICIFLHLMGQTRTWTEENIGLSTWLE